MYISFYEPSLKFLKKFYKHDRLHSAKDELHINLVSLIIVLDNLLVIGNS